MTGEFEKISEKNLTVKDFQQNRSTDRSLPDCYGRGYLRISVEINSNSHEYKSYTVNGVLIKSYFMRLAKSLNASQCSLLRTKSLLKSFPAT